MVALWWIKQVEKRWNIWVQNRVNVIRANSSPDIWFHIPSSSNSADISTRSISLAHLDLLHWFYGPQFLLDNIKIGHQKMSPCRLQKLKIERHCGFYMIKNLLLEKTISQKLKTL